jgi:hypothetical protein
MKYVGVKRNACGYCIGKHEEKKPFLRSRSKGRIILESILKDTQWKDGGRIHPDQVADPYEQGNEFSVFIKWEEFLD